MGRHKKVTIQKKEQGVSLPGASKVPPPVLNPEQTKSDIATIVTQAADQKLDTPLEEGKRRKNYTKRVQEEEALERERLANEATAKLTSRILTNILNLVVQRLPNPIPISEEEAGTFQAAVEAEMIKRLPAVTNWKEELNLAGSIGMILLPRLKKQKGGTNVHVVTSEQRPPEP